MARQGAARQGKARNSQTSKGIEMLVLSRKPHERILIGDDIAVTVIRIGPGNVRLGIEAPRDVHIVREELDLKPKPERSL